jgi:hypothetical protein
VGRIGVERIGSAGIEPRKCPRSGDLGSNPAQCLEAGLASWVSADLVWKALILTNRSVTTPASLKRYRTVTQIVTPEQKRGAAASHRASFLERAAYPERKIHPNRRVFVTVAAQFLRSHSAPTPCPRSANGTCFAISATLWLAFLLRITASWWKLAEQNVRSRKRPPIASLTPRRGPLLHNVYNSSAGDVG